MNFHGILLGVASFLSIGMFHPIVVKAEYYFTYKIWWLFLLVGVVLLGISTLIESLLLSSIVGVFGFSCLWSILELFHQKNRVEKGWFPANPNRK